MALDLPTPAELDVLEQPELDEQTAIQMAADLFVMATGVTDTPTDEVGVRMVKNAILEMAWALRTRHGDMEASFSPFSGERIGCVDEATEILTMTGWKHRKDLGIADLVLTINADSGLSEWCPVQRIHVFDPQPRKVLQIASRGFNSVTTLEHRWLLNGPSGWHWRTSAELAETPGSKEVIPYAAPFADVAVEAKHSDALVELVAWYWTEGGWAWRDRHQGVKIHQSRLKNPGNCARIRAALTEVFGPAGESLRIARTGQCLEPGCPNPVKARNYCNRHYMERWHAGGFSTPERRITWSETTRRDGEMAVFALSPQAAVVLSDHAPDRIVRSEFLCSLTRSQLELFIQVSLLADGSGPTQLAQKSKERAEQFMLANILSGRRVSIHQQRSGMWMVTTSTRTATRPYNLKYTGQKKGRYAVVDFNGLVWCPQTRNGTWLARREGTVYFTGNSYNYQKASNAILRKGTTQIKTDVPFFDSAVAYFNQRGRLKGINVTSEWVFANGYRCGSEPFAPSRTWVTPWFSKYEDPSVRWQEIEWAVIEQIDQL